MKLLPCPFCGNEDDINLVEEDKKYPWMVYCGNCSAQIDNWPLESQAIEQWNIRFYPPEVQAVIEAAKEYSEHNQLFWYDDNEPEYKILFAVCALEAAEKEGEE